MHKYDPLERYLRSVAAPRQTLTFSDVERIIGDKLPASSFKYAAHWRGTTAGRPAGAIAQAGWAIVKIEWANSSISLVRQS